MTPGLHPGQALSGRHALVTGGGTGIGAAIALALAGKGARVTITGRREAPLARVAAQSDRIDWRIMDVTDEAAVTTEMTAAEDAAPIDILIANAGIAETAPLGKLTTDAWRRSFATNVDGVMFTMRHVIDAMAVRGWGRIVVISSVSGLSGFRYGSAYAATKHAVLGLMKCAAGEMMTKGVTVNALCPGFVATPIVRRSVANIVASTGQTETQARDTLSAMNPFGRLIEPEEVAAAALWLCGPGSGAVTGQAIPISGGPL